MTSDHDSEAELHAIVVSAGIIHDVRVAIRRILGVEASSNFKSLYLAWEPVPASVATETLAILEKAFSLAPGYQGFHGFRKFAITLRAVEDAHGSTISVTLEKRSAKW